MATWFPSKERLRHLRAQGFFPWSRIATRSAIAAAVCGVFCLSTTWLQGLLAFCLQSKDQDMDPLRALFGLKGSSMLLFVTTAIGALCAGIGISLFQTGGVVSHAAVRAVRRRERSRNPMVVVVALVLTLNLAVCLEYVVAPRLLKVLGGGQELQTAPRYLGNVLDDTVKLVVVACVVLAVVLLFVSRLAFLLGLRRQARSVAGDET
jgi:hypothetical protein